MSERLALGLHVAAVPLGDRGQIPGRVSSDFPRVRRIPVVGHVELFGSEQDERVTLGGAQESRFPGQRLEALARFTRGLADRYSTREKSAAKVAADRNAP